MQAIPMASRNDSDLSRIVDKAADDCPATLGEAGDLAFGQEGGMRALVERLQTARLDRRRDREAHGSSARGLTPLQAYADERFRSGLDAGLVERGRNPATLTELTRQALSLEANAASITGKDFFNRIAEIKPLARAALAAAKQGFPAVDAPGPAFARWEQQYGQPISRTLAKLLAINEVRRSATWGMAGRRGDMDSSRGFGSAGEGLGEVTLGLEEIFRLYQTRLARKPVVDTAFMDRAMRGAQEQFKKAPTVDAAVTSAAPAPASGGGYTIFYGTPGQLAVAMAGRQLGQALASAAVVAAELGRMVNNRIVGERELAQARREFWSCYQQRCATPGPMLANYLSRLQLRDLNRLKFAQASSSTYAGVGSYVSGFHDVDFGSVTLCGFEHRQVLNLDSNMNPEPDDMKRLARLLRRPEGQAWMDCRDKAEYLLQPDS